MTVNSFQKGERLIVLALCSVNRKFLYFLYHKKIVLCSALPCFFTSSSSPHKIATLQEQTLWKPKVINSALWHSFTPLLWCQNLFSLSVLSQMLNVSWKTHIFLILIFHFLPHLLSITIGEGIVNSSEIKAQVRNNFHPSSRLKI